MPAANAPTTTEAAPNASKLPMTVARLADLCVWVFSGDSPARSSRAVCLFNLRSDHQIVPTAMTNALSSPTAHAVPEL
ncbi:MAG: hypothetical protein HOF61_06480 [Verrucomicrobia bacterium]|nr:hypothetical protein [Verrucomicrobiota bacterium]